MAKNVEAAAPQTNGLDPKQTRSYFTRLHTLHDKLESQAGETRKMIKGVYDEASDKLGIKKKVLIKIWKQERQDQKYKKWLGELDEEGTADLELLKASLGAFAELPLGAAAVTTAEKMQAQKADREAATVPSA